MNSRIYVSNRAEGRFIDLCDVLYLAAAAGRIMIHYETKGREEVIDFEGALKDLECRLNEEGFLRIHRSYIVNLRRVAAVQNDRVILDSKRLIKLPASRGLIKDLKDRLKDRQGVIIL